MKNLHFHYAKARNVLCFGEQGIELFLKDYGNVIQVRGVNLDNPGTEDHPASNGAGKSSVQEIFSIGLYGRTVKSPTKLKQGQILNVLADKGEVDIQWDNCRILRTFKRASTGTVTAKVQIWENPNRVWDDDSELTKGEGKIDTGKWVEGRLGLTHHAFCNVVIFDDSSSYSFLEADTPIKRQIVENLLGLDQYLGYHKNAKELLKNHKLQIVGFTNEYQRFQSDVDACDGRLTMLQNQNATWKATRERELRVLMESIKVKQDQLGKTNAGDLLVVWQNAQDRIAELTANSAELQSKRTGLVQIIEESRIKIKDAEANNNETQAVIQQKHLGLKKLEKDLEGALTLIEKLESLDEGTRCPVCHGIISSDNYSSVLMHTHNQVGGIQSNIQREGELITKDKEKFGEKAAKLSTIKVKVRDVETKAGEMEAQISQNRVQISQLTKIQRPDGDAAERVLEAEIVELKKQFKSKKDEYEGDSPYKEIIENTEQEKAQKKAAAELKSQELSKAEKEIPYFDFWIEAFGDNGIRKYIIDGIIPALNARVAYWLQYLIDSKIEVTFDNKLEETITRNGNPAFYYAMSNGERRRINLAVSQAFSYVMMLHSGCCPSVVFLDEITGGSIDRVGVVGIYNMIFELAKERQVFVTTHDESLLSMLQGCESITLKKQNDTTTLAT